MAVIAPKMAAIEEFEHISCLHYEKDTFKPNDCCANPKSISQSAKDLVIFEWAKEKAQIEHRSLGPSKTEHKWTEMEQN
ncbi:hypothetical protein niasHS_011898 [Heterodera schachtii]|uniref:Uncharacterized protein n=2 Tax=Heterodera TaxID=34509 RepID=A0ABD2IPF3_HETSC